DDVGNHFRLRRVETTAGNLRAQHEVAGGLRLLAVEPVPLEALELLLGNRREAELGVPVKIGQNIEAVLLLLDLLLTSEFAPTRLDVGEIHVFTRLCHRYLTKLPKNYNYRKGSNSFGVCKWKFGGGTGVPAHASKR